MNKFDAIRLPIGSLVSVNNEALAYVYNVLGCYDEVSNDWIINLVLTDAKTEKRVAIDPSCNNVVCVDLDENTSDIMY